MDFNLFYSIHLFFCCVCAVGFSLAYFSTTFPLRNEIHYVNDTSNKTKWNAIPSSTQWYTKTKKQNKTKQKQKKENENKNIWLTNKEVCAPQCKWHTAAAAAKRKANSLAKHTEQTNNWQVSISRMKSWSDSYSVIFFYVSWFIIVAHFITISAIFHVCFCFALFGCVLISFFVDYYLLIQFSFLV